jgi:hypothetical protein
VSLIKVHEPISVEFEDLEREKNAQHQTSSGESINGGGK